MQRKLDLKNQYLKVFGISLLTAFAFFLPFLIQDKGLFLYYGDFNVQQIPFYQLAHDAIRSGETLWNWNTDLGANFVGSYSFYLLGSPFFWLTIPFPSEAVPYLMAPLLILKFALTGVTGYAYIRRFTKTANMAVIGALLYSFSGFSVYNIFFNHFNEVIMVFPLLLIAMEELLMNNRRGGFALSVALCAVVNYYFFVGEVIFCILYFIFRCTSPDCRFELKKFITLGIEAVLGVLIAGVLLLPSAYAVMGNPRTGETLTGFDMLLYGNVQRYGLILSSFFFPPDIPARPNFFPDSNAKWSSVSMFLPMLSFTGVLAFFKAKKKHWAKSLLILSFVICFIPYLNAAFSAFNYSYYARWFYMPLLIMAMVSVIALEQYPKAFKFSIKWTTLFICIFALIGILPKKTNGKLVWFSLPSYNDRFWAYVIIALVGIICTIMLLQLGIKNRYFHRCAVLCICVITVVYSSFMIFTGKQAGDSYTMVVEQAIHGAEKLDLEQEGFYRIDTYNEMDNLGMFWKIPTINAFHSVVPYSIMDYYKLVGEERGVASRPKPEYAGIRGLLSVKYAFVKEDKTEPDMPGFSYYDTQNGFKIFENDHFVPMGFTYDYFLPQNGIAKVGNGQKDRLLLKGMHVDKETYLKYEEVMPILPASDMSSEALDDKAYFADCDSRADAAVDEFSYSNSGFTAKTSYETEELVFFSVPYDEGWSAKVNGEPAEIIKANGGFMAVYVPAGSSEIEFRYQTPGLLFGFLITGLGIILLLLYWFYIRKIRKTHSELCYRRYAHRNAENFFPIITAKNAYLENICEESVEPDQKDEANGSGEEKKEK